MAECKEDEITRFFDGIREETKYLTDGLKEMQDVWSSAQNITGDESKEKVVKIMEHLRNDISVLKTNVTNLKSDIEQLIEVSETFMNKTTKEYEESKLNFKESVIFLENHGISMNGSKGSNISLDIISSNEMVSKLIDESLSESKFSDNAIQFSTPLVIKKKE